MHEEVFDAVMIANGHHAVPVRAAPLRGPSTRAAH